MLTANKSRNRVQRSRVEEVTRNRRIVKRRLGTEQQLYEQGSQSVTLYLVKEGILKGEVTTSIGKVRITDVYGEGDLLGLAALTGGEHLDSAVALTPCLLEVVEPSWGFGGGEFRQRYADALGRQTQRAQQKVINMDLPAGARIAAMFLELAERFGFEEGRGFLNFNLPLTHVEFAALISASRPTTTMVIGKLRQSGALEDGLGLGNFRVDRRKLEAALDDYVLEAL